MVGEISPDIISTISQIFNIPVINLFVSFPLGFVILYSLFYYNKREWDKIGEIGKTIFSFFIGFSIYFIMKFYLTFLLLPLTWVIFQPELLSQIDNFISFILGATFLVYLQQFIKNKYRKEKIINGALKIFTFFSLLISFTLFAISISTLYSSLNFTSGLPSALGIITISFSFVGIFLIGSFFKEKKAKKVMNIFPKKPLFYLFAIAVFISSILILNYFFLPKVAYYSTIEKSYLIDGKNYMPIEWNQQFWSSYKAVEIPIKIENGGFFGWIPIDYGNMVFNISVPLINASFNNTNFLIQNNTFPNEQITKSLGLKNMTIDESFNKVLLFFDRYSFLDNKRLNNMFLDGYETTSINESYYDFNYSYPQIDNNSVLLQADVVNRLPKSLEFQNIFLFAYKNNQFSDCKFQKINGILRNSTFIFNLGNQYGSCEKDVCYLSFPHGESVYIVNEGYIKVNMIQLNPNTEINFSVLLNCTE